MRIDDGTRATSRGAGRARRPTQASSGSTSRTAAEPANRAAREGDRPIGRHGDVRRQGHGVPAVEVRPARQGLPLPVFDEPPRRPPLWSTSADAADARLDHPAFGGASWVCNVIDTRQSYLQKLLKQALAALGYERAGRRTRCTTRTRWSRCPTPPRASSATTRVSTRTGRSSRCRDARASASRRTICWTG